MISCCFAYFSSIFSSASSPDYSESELEEDELLSSFLSHSKKSDDSALNCFSFFLK